mmetsp:Transcript_40394/g.129664  ORF Transcript_40394/g.129664 Transcript_40394/m.129664 type:complete len:1051 (-) Transcript_40394:50-3202(-)
MRSNPLLRRRQVAEASPSGPQDGESTLSLGSFGGSSASTAAQPAPSKWGLRRLNPLLAGSPASSSTSSLRAPASSPTGSPWPEAGSSAGSGFGRLSHRRTLSAEEPPRPNPLLGSPPPSDPGSNLTCSAARGHRRTLSAEEPKRSPSEHASASSSVPVGGMCHRDRGGLSPAEDAGTVVAASFPGFVHRRTLSAQEPQRSNPLLGSPVLSEGSAAGVGTTARGARHRRALSVDDVDRPSEPLGSPMPSESESIATPSTIGTTRHRRTLSAQEPQRPNPLLGSPASIPGFGHQRTLSAEQPQRPNPLLSPSVSVGSAGEGADASQLRRRSTGSVSSSTTGLSPDGRLASDSGRREASASQRIAAALSPAALLESLMAPRSASGQPSTCSSLPMAASSGDAAGGLELSLAPASDGIGGPRVVVVAAAPPPRKEDEARGAAHGQGAPADAHVPLPEGLRWQIEVGDAGETKFGSTDDVEEDGVASASGPGRADEHQSAAPLRLAASSFECPDVGGSHGWTDVRAGLDFSVFEARPLDGVDGQGFELQLPTSSPTREQDGGGSSGWAVVAADLDFSVFDTPASDDQGLKLQLPVAGREDMPGACSPWAAVAGDLDFSVLEAPRLDTVDEQGELQRLFQPPTIEQSSGRELVREDQPEGLAVDLDPPILFLDEDELDPPILFLPEGRGAVADAGDGRLPAAIGPGRSPGQCRLASPRQTVVDTPPLGEVAMLPLDRLPQEVAEKQASKPDGCRSEDVATASIIRIDGTSMPPPFTLHVLSSVALPEAELWGLRPEARALEVTCVEGELKVGLAVQPDDFWVQVLPDAVARSRLAPLHFEVSLAGATLALRHLAGEAAATVLNGRPVVDEAQALPGDVIGVGAPGGPSLVRFRVLALGDLFDESDDGALRGLGLGDLDGRGGGGFLVEDLVEFAPAGPGGEPPPLRSQQHAEARGAAAEDIGAADAEQAKHSRGSLRPGRHSARAVLLEAAPPPLLASLRPIEADEDDEFDAFAGASASAAGCLVSGAAARGRAVSIASCGSGGSGDGASSACLVS